MEKIIITNEYEVYNFEELSDEAKDFVIEDYYNDEWNMQIECDNFTEMSTELLTLIGFEDVKVSWDLSHSQGDYFDFEFSHIYSHNIIEILEGIINNKPKEIGYKFLEENISELSNELHNMNFELKKEIIEDVYITYNSRYDECEYDDTWLEDKGYTEDEASDYCDKIDKVMKMIYSTLCSNLRERGYKDINYRMSYEDMQELSESNGYTYLVDGKMFNK